MDNQREAAAGSLEGAATALLAGMVALVALGSWL
jgi:hypothetical protein